MTLGLVLLTLLAADGPAPGPAPAPASEPAERWYGGPAVAMDAGALAVVIGGFALGGKTGVALGLVGLTAGVFVTPFNHAWADDRTRIDPSVELRAGGLVLGLAAFLVVGLEDRDCVRESPDPTCPALRETVLLAPLALAMLIDDAFLSHAPVARGPRGTAAARWSPTLRLAGGGAVAGVAGAF